MRGLLGASLAIPLTVASLPAGAAVAEPRPRFTPGAPSVGDPYYPGDGNGGYDVRRYQLKLAYQPGRDRLIGRATIKARATKDLSRFNLDLDGLRVRSVRVKGKPARWWRRGEELIVKPRRGLRDDRRFRVVVRYAGVPETLPDSSGFFHTEDGAVVLGQPKVADTWFPVNDHPVDPASFRISITVPRGLQALSNGVLRSRVAVGSRTRWTWLAREPMAPYLAMMAIGEYDVRSYRRAGLRFWDALDRSLDSSLRTNADASFRRQPEVIRFLERIFGDYPFSSAGGVVDNEDNLFFALETQTRPVYSKYFFGDPAGGDYVVVHEYAHQWTGDLLRLQRWRHIWLNEGFASYTEWLWSGRVGQGSPQQIFDSLAAIPARNRFWRVRPGNPGPDNLFDGAVYDRGAMTLHALRREVGDRDFFRILRRWVATQAGDTVTTREFLRLAERISGEQLDRLFRVWLFTPRKPRGITPDQTSAGADELRERWLSRRDVRP